MKRSQQKNKRENSLASRLASSFTPPYKEIHKVIKKIIHKSSIIIDIGSNDGMIEEYIDETKLPHTVFCLDVNKEALKELKKRKFKYIAIKTIHQDANSFLAITKQRFDVILINNTLHETNTPTDQASYLDIFFRNIKKMLKPSGKLILADHYYAKHLSDQKVADYIEQQFKKIKHASNRKEFILPGLIKQKIKQHGLTITYSSECRVTNLIDKRYYVFVIGL